MKLEDAIIEIKRRTDLVRVIGQTVKLKKHGPNYLGLCPFHGEKTPSFNVRPDKGYFKCFGCGASGDVFSFLEKQSGQLFIDIVKRLAGELGVTLDQSFQPNKTTSSALEALEQAQTFFRENLKGEALAYLTQKRKYPEKIIEAHGLGFGGSTNLPGLALFNSRITIPIRNHRGQLVGFGGRIFGAAEKDRPKYVNSPASEVYEKSHILYGLYESLPLIKQQKRVVLVEGYFDVIALLAVGVPAVAPCGTSLTEAHADLLKKYTSEIILCFDQDAAGKAAHQKALMLFLSKGFQTRAVHLTDKDPDSLWQQEQGDLLVKLCDEAKDAVQMRIEQALQDGMGGVHERIQALQALLPFLSAYPDPLVNRQYVRLAAQILKEDESLLVRSVLKHRPGSLAQIPKPAAAPKEKIIWTDAEKLLLRALITHPEILRDKIEILEADLNKDFLSFVERLLNLSPEQDPLSIPVPRDSSVIQQLQEAFGHLELITREDAEKILAGWLIRISQKKKNAWLSEQHQKLLLASSQGNLEQVRQALKSQSGVLKKSWT
ncbi:MAG: CHC2 zinc finger domain-containing protein [Myxococcaceae bacterium]